MHGLLAGAKTGILSQESIVRQTPHTHVSLPTLD